MSQQKIIGLVQINNSFSGQNYFPYSMGILQAYAQKYCKNSKNLKFLIPIYKRISIQDAINALKDSDVILFSVYVWNVKISCEIAKNIKSIKPSALIVFGGPHIPNSCEAFLRNHPYVDLACNGEGEITVASILDNLENSSWENVPSINHIDQNGKFITTKRSARMNNLSSIPSPYLTGVFDPLMQAYPDEHWIGLWETNRGCPFTCAYCDWGSSTHNQIFTFDTERLFKEIDWFSQHKIEFLFCADSNFGIMPRDFKLVKYLVGIKEKNGYPHALSVQTTKNATDQLYRLSTMLSQAGLNKGISLSLQSVDPTTLKNIKRQNISTETFRELQRRLTKDRVETFTDVILGLPGETYKSFTHGIADIIDNGQHNRIQFHNLSILPNAEMGNVEYQKLHGMKTVTNKIVNIHGSNIETLDNICETQELVIATNTMPEKNWKKTRVFSWMTGFLHFNKIFQIPLILLHEKYCISYKDLIEIFSNGEFPAPSVLLEIKKFFNDKAGRIQKGEEEFYESKEWLNIWWPTDELAFIHICTRNKIEKFYQEAEAAIIQYFHRHNTPLDTELLHEAITLNKNLIKLPFQKNDQDILLSHNIWEFYHSALFGEKIELEYRPSHFLIKKSEKTWNSWEDWCREVVWWCNKKGGYLYNIQKI